MWKKGLFITVSAVLLLAASSGVAISAPCDDMTQCCVNTNACVITDKVTLAGLTIDEIIACDFQLGTYVTGGNAATGIAPAGFPANECGLSFSGTVESAASALNTLNSHWLQSATIPKVVDFGSPVNTAIVFVAVDHGPFPEEGIESTVWGRDNPDLTNFPTGWTLGTLTTIWKKGWKEPPQCEPGDNADDFTGQYSFSGNGFRYIAVHANFSISIFDDPSHTTWPSSGDDSSKLGWQSFDDEIDAVGTPECQQGAVIADAGADQEGSVGQELCFDGSGSTAQDGISTIGWDLDGDSEIDVNGPEACFTCEEESEGDVTLFVSDTCGCVDSDTAHFRCILCDDPDPRTQGYWNRQCLGAGLITAGRNGRGPTEVLEPEFLKDLVPAVDLQLQGSVFETRTCEDGMDAVPPSDPCERALKQYTALLLNVESGRLQNGCEVDPLVVGCSSTNIGDLVNELAGLINSGDPDMCKQAAECAGAVNEGLGILLPAGSGVPVAADQDFGGLPGIDPVVQESEAGPEIIEVSTTGAEASNPMVTSEEAIEMEPTDPVVLQVVGIETPAEVEPSGQEPDVAEIGAAKALDRHLAVLTNPSAPEKARKISEDALLNALGGGYEPERRIGIVKILVGQVDVALHSLLAKHLEDIRAEAREAGDVKLDKEADRLLKQLEPTQE